VRRCSIILRFLFAAIMLAGLRPDAAQACAACYGASDSPMAHGMNWGIASLLVVVAGVLSSVAAFFIYLAKKSAVVSAATNKS
jgi:UPF0716 family protein affecting phage T7 exclusion